jgi:hypothetical protein
MTRRSITRAVAPFLGAVALALVIDVLAKTTAWASGWTYAFAGFGAALLLIFGTPFAFGRPLRFGAASAVPSTGDVSWLGAEEGASSGDLSFWLNISPQEVWTGPEEQVAISSYWLYLLLDTSMRDLDIRQDKPATPEGKEPRPSELVRWVEPRIPRRLPTLALPVEQTDPTQPPAHPAAPALA